MSSSFRHFGCCKEFMCVVQVLRTCFIDTADGPQQVVLPASAVELEVSVAATNGSALLQPQPAGGFAIHSESSLAADWRQSSAAPFDLYRGPLIRIHVSSCYTSALHCSDLVWQNARRVASSLPNSASATQQLVWVPCVQVWRVTAGQHVLLVTQHHSITDGVSLGILSRDLAALYSAALHGNAPALPQLSAAYVDYAAWQRAHLTGEALDAQLAWWRETLQDAPALLELPTDRPRPSRMSFAGAQLSFGTPAAVRQGLQQLATAQQTTPFVVAAAALQVSRSRASCRWCRAWSSLLCEACTRSAAVL